MSDEVGAASDRGPDAGVSIISEASIADLARTGGAEALDSRRFRMLFEIDGVEPYAEDTWIGREVRIGEAVVLPARERRALRGHDVRSRDRPSATSTRSACSRPTAREIETTEPLPLGVVGDVVTTGRVRVGDPVTPLETPSEVSR